MTLDIKAEVENIAVLNGVVPAFRPHPAGFLGALLAAAGHEIGIGDGLGADGAALEVAMTETVRPRRLGATPDRPGARLLRPGGEESEQVEQRVAGTDQAGK